MPADRRIKVHHKCLFFTRLAKANYLNRLLALRQSADDHESAMSSFSEEIAHSR